MKILQEWGGNSYTVEDDQGNRMRAVTREFAIFAAGVSAALGGEQTDLREIADLWMQANRSMAQSEYRANEWRAK